MLFPHAKQWFVIIFLRLCIHLIVCVDFNSLRDVHVVDDDPTRDRFDDTEKRNGERAFSSACPSNDTHLLAGMYFQIDISQYQVHAFPVENKRGAEVTQVENVQLFTFEWCWPVSCWVVYKGDVSVRWPICINNRPILSGPWRFAFDLSSPLNGNIIIIPLQIRNFHSKVRPLHTGQVIQKVTTQT